MGRYLGQAVLTLSGVIALPAWAEFNYDDCILNGLRGASSEVAARLIKQACESKRSAAERAQAEIHERRLRNEYGEEATHSLLAQIFAEGGSDGQFRLRNQSDKTVTFVRVNFAPSERGFCGAATSIPYRVTLSPGASSEIPFKAPAGIRDICVTVGYARWRPQQLVDWKALFEVRAERLAHDPFQGRLDVSPPAPPPRPAPAAAPPTSSLLNAAGYFRQAADEAVKGR